MSILSGNIYKIRFLKNGLMDSCQVTRDIEKFRAHPLSGNDLA